MAEVPPKEKIECTQCRKQFKYPSDLQRHLQRKKPCAPILDRDGQEKDGHVCRYCGRDFSSQTSMYRHIRKYCKIAGSEEGMDLLLDHTLQRQLAAQKREIEELKAQMKDLAAQGGGRQVGAVVQGGASSNVLGSGVQNNTQNNITINIRPWDGEERIHIPVDLIRAAFAENARLAEYCGLSDAEKVDDKQARPYVTEALVDLTRRAHQDPLARNVYLNPRRADQVLVCMKTGGWEVRPLAEATRLLFDGVATGIHRATITDEERRQLPDGVQGAVPWIPMLYRQDQERYVADARQPMAAHLANTKPALSGPAPIEGEPQN